jgi:2'-5' RNA ligase
VITLGVAIAIPQPHAEVLTGWRRDVGDPQWSRIWPHVTLLPPTTVPAELLPQIQAHLAQAARLVEPFEIALRGTGTFRPVSPVVFVQLAHGIEQCCQLAAAVRSGPLAAELDFPYHPHVTVAQEVGEAALDVAYDGLAGFAAEFWVGHFLLCHREDLSGERHWQRLAEFPLGACSA